MKPRVHAEIIKAWADGAEIQSKWGDSGWVDCSEPHWYEASEYRVKPQEVIKKYDVSLQKGFTLVDADNHLYHPYNLVLTFDGVSGHLKSAEVV
jgi:hypothetical protein